MWAYPEIRTLGDYPDYYARRDPERVALKTADRAVNFAEFDERANQSAHFLLRQGAEAEQLIGFMGKNSLDFYFALFGSARTRAGMVVLNWRLAAPELAQQIADSAARIVIIEREQEPLWSAACALLDSPPRPIWIDETGTYEAMIADQPVLRPDVNVSEDDTAFQLYTSGTTGKPKGVMLAHKGTNMMRLSEHFEPAYQLEDGDSFINALPNFHLLHLGITLQCLYNGVSITVVRQFDPALVLATISKQRPTLLTLTPTMLQMLLDHPDAPTTDFSSLRLTLYAGSPRQAEPRRSSARTNMIWRTKPNCKVAVVRCRSLSFASSTATAKRLRKVNPANFSFANLRSPKAIGDNPKPPRASSAMAGTAAETSSAAMLKGFTISSTARRT
jgi:acyl-CoA synthetase (AMP-forming)/AMP-acid ligase II